MIAGLGPKTRQGQLILLRWIDRLSLGLLAALLVLAARPPLHELVARFPIDIDILWLSLPAILLAAFPLAFAARQAVARNGLWPKAWLRQPGWIVASACGCVGGFALSGGEPILSSLALAASAFAISLLILCMWVASAGLPVSGDRLPVADDPTPVSTEEEQRAAMQALLDDPDRLQAWIDGETPLAVDGVDLVGIGSATRRVRDAMRHGLTLGLLGPFGGGKSTVVARAHAPLVAKGHVLAAVDGAGLDHQHAAAAVLAAGLDALRPHFDITGFAGLPAAYEAAARGLTPAGFRWLFDLPAVDPHRQLTKLNAALEAAGLTLTFDVRDLDRRGDTGPALDGLQGLLDRLRNDDCQRLNFVVSVGEDAGLDLARLCQRIVHLPELLPQAVRQLCNATRRMHLLASLDHGILLPDETRESVVATDLMRKVPPWSLIDPVKLTNKEAPLDLDAAFCSLIDTPRQLKAVLRAATQNWKSLEGQIDFNALLLMEAVRTVAPAAIGVIAAHPGPLKGTYGAPKEGSLLEVIDSRRSALEAILDLPPTKLQAVLDVAEVLAGNQHFSRVDASGELEELSTPWQTPLTRVGYFHRLQSVTLARGLMPDDQVLLRALAEAGQDRPGELVDLLSDERAFAAVWFCIRDPRVSVLPKYKPAATALVAGARVATRRCLAEHGASASLRRDGRACGFLAVLSIGHGLAPEARVQAAKRLMGESAATSLQLTIDLMECWCFGDAQVDAGSLIDKNHALGVDEREEVHAWMSEKLRTTLGGDSETFCAALSPRSSRYLLLLPRLVFLFDVKGAQGGATGLESWAWLLDLLETGLGEGRLPLADLLAGMATTGKEHPVLADQGECCFPVNVTLKDDRLKQWIPDDARRHRMLADAAELLLLPADPPHTAHERWRVEASEALKPFLANKTAGDGAAAVHCGDGHPPGTATA